MNNATWKIGLWLENDEAMYDGARECADGDNLEDWFISLCEENPAFAMQILLDLLGPVDWNQLHENVTEE